MPGIRELHQQILWSTSYRGQLSSPLPKTDGDWAGSTFETLANYLTESRNCFSGSNSNKMTAWQWALDNPLMEVGHLGHWTKQCCPRKAAEQPRKLRTPNSEFSFYSTELWVVSGEQLPSQGPLSQSSCCQKQQNVNGNDAHHFQTQAFQQLLHLCSPPHSTGWMQLSTPMCRQSHGMEEA